LIFDTLDVSDDDESGAPPSPRYRHCRATVIATAIATAIATMGKALP
jgi:hypothetical protein